MIGRVIAGLSAWCLWSAALTTVFAHDSWTTFVQLFLAIQLGTIGAGVVLVLAGYAMTGPMPKESDRPEESN